MNVILIVFDSLRKDCIGAYGAPPWGRVHTPHFDALAAESLVMTRAYPESLPTLPARHALYTGRRVYPFHNGNVRLRGDFASAGWGPIPEDEDTLAEILQAAGYRTALLSDLYHQFKPSKNYWRGFDEWQFLRGQETDRFRSGPRPTPAEIDRYLPKAWQNQDRIDFTRKSLMNRAGRLAEEDYFAAALLREASAWLERNQDADHFFLTIESFDPHEPWFAPEHYRRMYAPQSGLPEQQVVISKYDYLAPEDLPLVRLAQINYSAAVSLCDRWFGHFMESLRVLGRLDDTLVVFTTDHGHALGDGNYMGKWGYHAHPSIMDVALMLRFPKAEHAGLRSDLYVQHHDIAATILDAAGIEPSIPLDGISFLGDALAGRPGRRDHATIGWGSTPTVVTDDWWLNCKVDGTGTILYDQRCPDPYARNVAREHPEIVHDLFALAKGDALGGFPDWLLEAAKKQYEAPGCSDLAANDSV